MFQLMRNIHLALGLLFVLMASIFALSSLVIAYRAWLPQTPVDSERSVQIDEASAGTPPRALARALMQREGLKGDLRNIEEDPKAVRFRILRPGTQVDVEWERSTGQATLKTRRMGAAPDDGPAPHQPWVLARLLAFKPVGRLLAAGLGWLAADGRKRDLPLVRSP